MATNMKSMKKIKLFATGQSRYCQSCGAESLKLFAIIPADQKTCQLQYCKTCYDKDKKTAGQK